MHRALPDLRVRLLRRCLVPILALVAPLAPVAVAPAAADGAAAEPLFASATTGFTTNEAPVVGQPFQIVGQVFLLFGDSPAPLPNVTVVLERRRQAGHPWAEVATTTTKETTLPNGEKHIMFTFNRVADRTESYRVRYDGDPESEAIGPSKSDDGDLDPAVVRVQRKMPIRLVQPKPSRIYMAGSVTPRYARQRVTVLRKTCAKCAWKSYARPLTDAKGRYRVRLSAPRRGAHFFVARARASQGFAQSRSQQARIQGG